MGSSASKETTTSSPQSVTNKSIGYILTRDDEWWWDSNHRSYISFNDDGTGRLVLGAENSVWIAAEFRWEVGSALDLILNPASHKAGGDVLAQFGMQITLTRRSWGPGNSDSRRYTINGAVLTDDAFLPKKYTLTLASGRFVTADLAGLQPVKLPLFTPWYAFRLSFDPSPYPPREEWKASAGMAADALKF